MRVDQADDGPDEPAPAADTSGRRDTSDAPAERSADSVPPDASVRVDRTLSNRAEVDAVNRRYAIDQGYERMREVEEKTVTPAMRRIEAEDSERHLAGMSNRLKDKDRLTEKVEKWMSAQADLRPEDAFRLVKDGMRYSLVYSEEKYTQGVYADCDRLKAAGFEPGDRAGHWENDQYRGINSRWREPQSGLLFEVQFHTKTSYDARQVTHAAYERIRDTSTPPDEVRRLKDYQHEVNIGIPVPPGATEIPDYNYLRRT